MIFGCVKRTPRYVARDMMECKQGRCQVPRWMTSVLWAASIYCMAFSFVSICWPDQAFASTGMHATGHHPLVRMIGLLYLVFAMSCLFAARDPIRHWRLVLLCTVKTVAVILVAVITWWQDIIPPRLAILLVLDDLVWLIPFLMILWSTVQAHLGRPPRYQEPLSIAEAASSYELSSGESLTEASQQQEIVLVFLRHFGCTFTRQLLRGLELLETQASQRQARLVLVHMLQSGKELAYLGDRSGIARIADPYCELYRSFGLGKAGFWELFGPRVWLRGLLALIRGCGVGSIAGDGLQMPGVFLFHRNSIIASQPAQSAADLPDLEKLFRKTN